MSIETVPETWQGSTEEHVRKVAIATNLIMGGNLNSVMMVTLDTNSSETLVVRSGIDSAFKVFLTAMSESAAEVTGLWAKADRDQITIHHNSSSADDRTFAMLYVR